METSPHHLSWFTITAFALELISALLGIVGAALMSRRFAPHFFRSMLYAAAWPLLCLFGEGRRARAFFEAKAKINWNVPESAADMALGLNLLFWVFFLQLLALLLK